VRVTKVYEGSGDLIVIQTDVEEHEVGYLAVAAAQRYSVLVTALNEPKGNYLIYADQE